MRGDIRQPFGGRYWKEASWLFRIWNALSFWSKGRPTICWVTAAKQSKGRQLMPEYPSNFKTPAGEAKYVAAYDATLTLWGIPGEGRSGSLHRNRCGLSRNATPADVS